MNVLVIAHHQGDGSPTASFIHAQIKEYAAQGHKVKVLVPVPVLKKDYYGNRVSKEINCKIIEGISHCFIRYLSFSNFGAYSLNIISIKRVLIRRFRDLFSDFSPDVIHAHTIGLDSEAACYIKEYLKIPVVVTVHGTDVTRLLEQSRKTISSFCNHPDVIVAVSSKLAEKLQPYILSTKVAVILNGFDLMHSQGQSKDPFRIIQVGNLIPLKRFDTTIRALKIIREKNNQASLVVIGDGPERSSLERLCTELQLEDSVSFLGQMDNSSVLKEMAKSTYYVMASSPEGFGVVYLEAMSMGCVTIGTKGEGISDLITNGENGFLVDVDSPQKIADIIISMHEDEDQRIAIANNGYNSVQNLTWRNNAQKYIQLFKELIG